jgi:hypothetical protein
MLAVEVVLGDHLLVALTEQAAQVVVVLQAQQIQPTLEVLIQVVAVQVILMGQTIQPLATLAVVAAQASSSFHTQAQHNYLVVELLPNQAVTSFTHLHLLAHLALCHL